MHTRLSRILSVTVVALLSAVGARIAHPLANATPPAQAGDGSLLFVENVGQFDNRARFQVRGGPTTKWRSEASRRLTVVAA
jgi:hypothetical protein